VFEQVQLSDLILVIGPRATDLNTAGFMTDMPHIETIKFGRDTVEMRGQDVARLKMGGVITKLSEAFDGRMSPSNSSASTPARKVSVTSERDNSVSSASTPPKGSIYWDQTLDFQGGILDKSSPLTQEWVWQRISTWLEEDDIIAADMGTSLFGTTWTRYPRGVVLLSQYLWCSIGYAVGAAVGAAIAAREDEQSPRPFADALFFSQETVASK
jgi:pyruvate decarboxylase